MRPMRERVENLLSDLHTSWPYLTALFLGLCAVFGFILYHITNSKNEQLKSKETHIDILREQVKSAEQHAKQLSDILPLSQSVINIHERFKALEQKVALFGFSTQIFPTTGVISVAGGFLRAGTPLSDHIHQAKKYISQKQFDLALKKADEIQEQLPGFPGSTYIKYLVNREKGYEDEAAKYAEKLLLETPLYLQQDEASMGARNRTNNNLSDDSLTHVYKYLTEYFLKKHHKKEAEDLATRPLSIWQDSPVHSEWVSEWKDFFQTTFGYLPARQP